MDIVRVINKTPKSIFSFLQLFNLLSCAEAGFHSNPLVIPKTPSFLPSYNSSTYPPGEGLGPLNVLVDLPQSIPFLLPVIT